MVKKILANTYIYLILFLMYLPVFYLIVFSFTDTEMVGQWGGFSFALFGKLFQSKEVGVAIGNTVILALTASLVSTLLGSLGAIGLFYSKKRFRTVVEHINQIPVVNAEIIIAVALTVMFTFLSRNIFKASQALSFWTLLIGHCALTTPFVYLNVKPKLIQMDPALYEAALDLGYTPTKALHKVIIPEIMPGIFAGFTLSLSLSLDDFVVTFFTRGTGLLNGGETIETISTLVEEKIKRGDVPPEMRAFTTILFLGIVTFVLVKTIITNHKAKVHGSTLGKNHAKRRDSLNVKLH